MDLTEFMELLDKRIRQEIETIQDGSVFILNTGLQMLPRNVIDRLWMDFDEVAKKFDGYFYIEEQFESDEPIHDPEGDNDDYQIDLMRYRNAFGEDEPI